MESTEPPRAPTRRSAVTRTGWAVAALVVALAVVGGVLGYRYWVAKPPEKPPAGDPWFEDVTDQWGIDFTHDAGELGTYLMSQINGSGVAVFDFDGDDKLDLYFLTHGGPEGQPTNRLYQNLGGGKFQDVTATSGLGIAGLNTGVIAGDVNNDGKPDIVLTQVNSVRLFLNEGEGRFRDATEESGLRNPVWATSANLFDFDRDGFLDLVVANYVEFDPNRVCRDATSRREYCGPVLFPTTATKLFRNLGSQPGKPGVRFEDVTVSSGLAKVTGTGLGVYCADFDGDGWQDIFVANDLKPNRLWINQKNGTFADEGLHRGIALDAMGLAQSGMGVAVGDFDGNGMIDVYVTHLSSERNTLWVQGPKRGYFRDQTARTGLLGGGWQGTGWGTTMADFDQDGWPDLALVNGRVTRGTTTPNPAVGEHFKEYTERNQLFRNDGKGKFQDVSEADKALCGTPNMARGLASGDLDGDGAVDLVVTNVAGRAQVLRNAVPNRGHWLSVRAFDPRLKRDAFGAEVRVAVGGRTLLRVVNPGDSFQSSSDPRAHFGLGGAGRYEEVHVVWPDGLSEVFPGGDTDRAIVLRRGEGRAEPRKEGS